MADRPVIEAAPPSARERETVDVQRLERTLAAIVDHLHAAVRESAPTRAELIAAADFLAETGRISDARRQEFVLLSDVLGVSALVEAINTRRPPGATPSTLRDPFYVPDAPERTPGADIRLAGPGEPLAVSVRVRDLAGRAIHGARVETWQANRDGVSDLQDPDGQPEHNLRGVFHTDADGRVAWRTIRPGAYAAPATDRWRAARAARTRLTGETPAHLNFRISARGYEPLTTRSRRGRPRARERRQSFAVRAGLAQPFRREAGG